MNTTSEDELEDDLVDFTTSCGLTASTEDQDRLRRARLPLLIRSVLPGATAPIQRLAAHWLAVFCALDDVVEREPPGPVFTAMLGGGARAGALSKSAIDVVVGALRVQVECRHRSRSDGARFSDDLRQLGLAFERERAMVHGDPTVDEYLELRALTVGVAPFFSLVGSTAAPDVIRECALAVGLSNDLATVERERAAGDLANIVLLLERQGASPADALAAARELAGAALARVESSGAAEAVAWVRGHEAWARETDRYRAGGAATKIIWKFPFTIADEFTVEMPVRAHVLDVQLQRGAPCLWAIVDPRAEMETRRFRVFGTGHPLDDGALAYIGTFQVADGALVWHLFEVVS